MSLARGWKEEEEEEAVEEEDFLSKRKGENILKMGNYLCRSQEVKLKKRAFCFFVSREIHISPNVDEFLNVH